MRRLKALVLFTLGYALMALLSPAVALPAVLAFAVASFVLVRPAEPAAPAEALARELTRRR